jgi:hypothetical protein
MTKYVHSNGERLVVRDIGPELWEANISTRDFPLPIITHSIMEDEQARDIMRRVLISKKYTTVSL